MVEDCFDGVKGIKEDTVGASNAVMNDSIALKGRVLRLDQSGHSHEYISMDEILSLVRSCRGLKNCHDFSKKG